MVGECSGRREPPPAVDELDTLLIDDPLNNPPGVTDTPGDGNIGFPPAAAVAVAPSRGVEVIGFSHIVG